MPPASDSFDTAQPLSAQEVRRALQRASVARAAAEAAHEMGPHRVTVSMIIARAGIHRQAFYDLFDNAKDALAYSWQVGRRALLAAMTRAADREDWAGRVEAVISALLARAEAEPYLVELYLTYGQTIKDDQGPFDSAVVDAIAGVLRPGRPTSADRPPGTRAEDLITLGILSVVAERLRRGEYASLSALGPELTELATRPFTDEGSEGAT